MGLVMTCSATGVCVLSIDLFPGSVATGPTGRAFDPAVSELRERLAAADLPATWAMSAGDLLEASRSAAAPPAQSEIALIADRAWAGVEANRERFAVGLARSLAEARAAGYRPTTLVFEEGPGEFYDDLLVKYGITAVRQRVAHPGSVTFARSNARNALPGTVGCLRSLRWGLWELDAVDALDLGPRRTLKTLDRAAREAGEIAIVIDGAKLASGLKAVARLFDRLNRLRGNGTLVTPTVCEAVLSRLPNRQVPAACSILRRAA